MVQYDDIHKPNGTRKPEVNGSTYEKMCTKHPKSKFITYRAHKIKACRITDNRKKGRLGPERRRTNYQRGYWRPRGNKMRCFQRQDRWWNNGRKTNQGPEAMKQNSRERPDVQP